MKTSWRMLSLLAALLMALSVPVFAEQTTSALGIPATIQGGATLLGKPRADANFVADLQDGVPVKVQTLGLAWSRVAAAGMEGWTASRFLRFSSVGKDSVFAVILAKNGRLTLRAEPATSAKELGKYMNGNIAAVLETGKPFTKVALDGKEGYLLTAHLKFTGARESVGTGVVSWPDDPLRERNITLRWEDKTGDNRITTIKTGTPFVLLKRGDEWGEIEVLGKTGFMMSDYLLEDAAPSTVTDAPVLEEPAETEQPEAEVTEAIMEDEPTIPPN